MAVKQPDSTYGWTVRHDLATPLPNNIIVRVWFGVQGTSNSSSKATRDQSVSAYLRVNVPLACLRRGVSEPGLASRAVWMQLLLAQAPLNSSRRCALPAGTLERHRESAHRLPALVVGRAGQSQRVALWNRRGCHGPPCGAPAPGAVDFLDSPSRPLSSSISPPTVLGWFSSIHALSPSPGLPRSGVGYRGGRSVGDRRCSSPPPSWQVRHAQEEDLPCRQSRGRNCRGRHKWEGAKARPRMNGRFGSRV